MSNVGTVYLLHFDRPLQHYLGWAQDHMDRVNDHLDGRGAKIMAAAVAAGIQAELVRTWEGKTRKFERKLKNRKNARGLCPKCIEGHNERAAASMRKTRARRRRAAR